MIGRSRRELCSIYVVVPCGRGGEGTVDWLELSCLTRAELTLELNLTLTKLDPVLSPSW